MTETEDYFIDLVFYNIELKCYVLIDLKMAKITHQDVGQIDMYVRMYDELSKAMKFFPDKEKKATVPEVLKANRTVAFYVFIIK